MSKRKQRLTIIGVFALFFLPVLAAYILRLNPIGLTTVNYGQLVEPPRLTSASELTVQHELEHSAKLFVEDWTMIVVGGAGCDLACSNTLDATRQARIAVNKDFDRVRRVLLTTGKLKQADADALLKQHPDLTFAIAPQSWIEDFTSAHESPSAVWLVDPRGFQFMVYPGKLNPTHLLKDLKRLLKISAVG